LIWDKDRYKVKIRVDPETYKVITTNPEELRKIEEADKTSKAEALTKQLLEQDLGYAPASVESGLMELMNKIRNKSNIKKIIKHYPEEYRKLIAGSIRKK